MPSTRKSEQWTPLVGVGILAAMVTLTYVLLPPEPTGPRFAGQGAAEDSPHYGGSFVFHHETDVRGFDPHASFDELSLMGIKLLFEGLIDYDDELNIVPRLAVTLPEVSEGGRLYHFRLRRGVHFHPPVHRELVAEDVRWSLEHMLHPDTGSPGASFYSLIEGLEAYQSGEAEHVSGIQVLDRYNLSIRLRQADQTFLYTMAMSFAYPVARENYEAHPEDVARHPVGTGAFLLENWEPGVRVSFVKNPRFFIPSQPYVDRMIYELNLQRGPAFLRFRNGELDHVHRFSPADYLFMQQSEAWQPYLRESPSTDLWGLTMNCEMAPFDNLHLRRAVSFAINGERWRRARANRLLLSGQPIPRNLPGYQADMPGQHHYNLERAREEMRLAGHPDGLEDEVEMWIGEGDTSRAYGELTQHDLAAIGIRLRLKPVAFPIYLQEAGKPGTVQLMLGGWNMDFPDPANFLDILFHSRSIHPQNSENRAFYRNPELDRLLDEARVERQNERRLSLYRQASAILVHDAPWAFVFNNLSMEAWQPYVRGYRPNPVWSNMYRDLWLDLPRRRVQQALRRIPGGRRFAALNPLGQLGATPSHPSRSP